MVMRFLTNSAISSSNTAQRYLYAWLNFMRTPSPAGPGWTIPESSDGSTVDSSGTGANITSYTDLNQWVSGSSISWFVLRAPDGSKDFIFGRYDSSPANWRIYYSPGGLFAGGGVVTAVPGASDQANYMWGLIANGSESQLHVGADDTAPYGFWTLLHANGNFNSQVGAMGFIPLSAGVQPGDVDPYVFAIQVSSWSQLWNYDNGLRTETDIYNRTRVTGILPGSTVSRNIPCLSFTNSQGTLAPNGCQVDQNGADLSFPVPYGVRAVATSPTGFKGFSTFMQWNGTVRTPGEAFASNTRISLGYVNVPWNGTVPRSS